MNRLRLLLSSELVTERARNGHDDREVEGCYTDMGM